MVFAADCSKTVLVTNRSHFQRSQTQNSSHAVAIAANHGTERALGLASWIASRIRRKVVTVRSGRCLCG
ncbi:hypothetical protein PC118_g13822 [Phytophthora cactorum]|uniref:Uncharacterized protein n=1 Tax=Phytophthora cactorum TaxID=29920 RepID=A0A8T1FMX1_9STRA|nr:hypothetical protein PC118_g13822 [Phytophthora cactorum]KAG3058851.1 hypothetical protein PC121_g14178 [Phytophthora cactorum]